ncbi:MAG: hypothetical protein WC716_03570 [Chitinophagaceae bacterium]|jgi:hypothetical protein
MPSFPLESQLFIIPKSIYSKGFQHLWYYRKLFSDLFLIALNTVEKLPFQVMKGEFMAHTKPCSKYKATCCIKQQAACVYYSIPS